MPAGGSGSVERPLSDIEKIQLQRNKFFLKLGFGLFFVVNGIILGHAMLTDPKSVYSPDHHTNLRKQRLAAQEAAKAQTTVADPPQAAAPPA